MSLMDSQIAQHVQRTLMELDATFEVIEIDPDLADTASFCAHYGYSPEASANAIVVASKRPPGHNAVCVVLATTRLDVNRRVRALLEVRKLSFASAELTNELMGMLLGGVTPFGLPDGLPVLVDARVMELESVIVGGGNRATKILVNSEVFGRLPDASVIQDLANPISAFSEDG